MQFSAQPSVHSLRLSLLATLCNSLWSNPGTCSWSVREPFCFSEAALMPPVSRDAWAVAGRIRPLITLTPAVGA